MSDLVTIYPAAGPRKTYEEYQAKYEGLKSAFYQTDNGARKKAISEQVDELRAQYSGRITTQAKATWEESLAAFDAADKALEKRETAARRDLSKSAGEYLPVANAEVKAAQDADAVVAIYETAEGDNAYRYAVALEAQGRLGELMSQAAEPVDRAEINRTIKEVSSDAENLHYTEALTVERQAVIKQAKELEAMQNDYAEINSSFRETGLDISLGRLQIENVALPDGRIKQVYKVEPPASFEAAIRRGLGEGKKYAEAE